MKRWKQSEIDWLINNYPLVGQKESAAHLSKSAPSIRAKAARLGLKQDKESSFFKEWQLRAAQSKVGKKRPEQANVIKKLHADGKLKATQEKREKLSLISKERWKNQPHPKGMKGKKHSHEVKNLLSVKSKEQWERLTDEEKMLRNTKTIITRIKNGTYAPERNKCTWRAGWRTIGDHKKYFRSKWEANYACYLEWLKTKNEINDWCHEPDVFWFDGVRRGCVSYLPDFKILNNDGSIEYHEVKGWMDSRSKTKIKRMAKYHSNIKLIVIREKEYKEILKKLSAIIPGWEI